jgi:hypothetical protein
MSWKIRIQISVPDVNKDPGEPILCGSGIPLNPRDFRLQGNTLKKLSVAFSV